MENCHIKMKQMPISNQQCVVNLTPHVKHSEFVFVRDKNGQCRIAKIEQIYGELAHVKYYIRANDLSTKVVRKSENGSPIKLNDSELIEDTTTSDNVRYDSILGKCAVFKAHEHESLTDFLQNRKKSPMAYVCRYKLVKEQIGYRLEPVSWQPGEEELRMHADEFSDFDEQTVHTDTDTQSEPIADLNATIEQIHLSLTNSGDNNSSGDIKQPPQLVSPIRIVGNTVCKATRNQNNMTSNNKRSSPDPKLDNQDVSPSKRNKLNDECDSYGTLESPKNRTGKYTSPALDRMKNIKKNLNRSFATDTSIDMNETPTSPYVPEYKDDNPMKMTLRKESKTPLKERNDNTVNSQEKIRATESPLNVARRTIMKSTHSTRSSSRNKTPQLSVSFDTLADKTDNATAIATPSRRGPRQAKQEAMNKMWETFDSSPEVEKPRITTRRRTIAATPSTPKVKSTQQSLVTPRSKRMPQTPKTPKTPKGVMTPQQTRSLYRSGNLTPSIQSRQDSIGRQQTELEMIRDRLQVSAVPSSLPCREKEFASIYEFIIGKLKDGSGGCIYISGVPGTGKTATVTQVIKTIQSELKPKKLPVFDFVDINGMRLTEPRQAYVQIYRQLTGKTLAWAQARDLLETRFTAGAKKSIRPTILLVDELDIICNRKQDVVYNLFDWTVRKGARLIAITIANTMDLPERVLKLKVASRLGLTRVTFQPYTFKQLQEVVMTRLAGSNCFMADAVQLVARKVASVSGDCRRALDICRRATEIAEENSTRAAKKGIEINFGHITQALNEMFASPKVRAIKNCTKFEKLFLQAVASEITRTGIEEVEFQRVHWQIGTLASILGIKNPPTEDQAMLICMTLAANRLLIAEDSSAGLYQKIILNATVDDLYYALNVS